MSTNRGLFRLSLSEEVNYIIYNIYQKNEKYQIIHVCGMHTFFGSVWQANREDYDSAGCVKSCFVWCGAVITGSYKLGTIPKTGSRFYRQAVDRCRNNEGNPTYKVVYSSVLFH